MKLGKLDFLHVERAGELVGQPTKTAIVKLGLQGVLVAAIDPELSDTADFCEQYQIGPEYAVNCVILEAKRGDNTQLVACMIPATKRADVNGTIRRALGARKISFVPMETAINLTGMEYGAINPIGLPSDWPILIDSEAAGKAQAIIGSGIRDSKLLVSGALLAKLPNTTVLDLGKAD
jgi:prolyl-tRNA editing enzyme YbaK/EbsC (Cys-tRNA(Pro) deacylase)